VPDAIGICAAVATAMAAVVILAGALRALAAPGRAAATLADALRLGLELLLAAGLLRLARAQDPATLGLTAAVVAVRQVIARGVGFARRAAR
jgi:uncharacterized membrane protein